MKKKVLTIAVVILLCIIFSEYAWSADRGTINSDETMIGISLLAPSYMDTWTFNADIGDRVIINAVTTSGSLDTCITLYPPDGGPAEAGTCDCFWGGGDQLNHQLQKTGTYTLIMQDGCSLSRTGVYNLELLKIPGVVSSPEEAAGSDIVSGVTTNGSVDVASDMDAFRFWSSEGARVVITAVTTSGSLDTCITLYPPDGGPAEAGTCDCFWGGGDQLDHQLIKTGIYTMVIQDGCSLSKTGTYNASLLKIPGPVNSNIDVDGGAISSGQTLSGTINVPSDMDAFQFYGQATSDRLIVTAVTTSGSLDTCITLYPPDGGPAEASTCDCFWGGGDQLDYQLKKTGLYSIVIKDGCSLSHAGTYNVSVTKIPSALRPGIYNPYPSNGATVTNPTGFFSWDPVPGATGYDIYFGTYVIEPIYQIGNNFLSPSFAFPLMEFGTTYYWGVVAHTPSGDITGPAWWFTYSSIILPTPIISGFTPTSGPVGTAVSIIGSNFTQAPAVAFNGVSASITNATNTLINTTVPAGATTGSISVATNGGTAYSSVNFTVTEVQQQYTLNVVKAGTGDGDITVTTGSISWAGNSGTAVYNSNISVTLNATASNGSTFTSWNGCDSTNGNLCTVTMNNARSVTATFSLNQTQNCTLTITKSGNGYGRITGSPSGIDCGSVCSSAYNQGTSVTLTAIPENGCIFTGWSGGNCTTAATCITTVNGDTNITATFSLQTGTPKITVSPKSANFGSVQIETTSNPKTITIQNRGKGYLAINSIAITGSNASEFDETNNCSSLSPGGSCTIIASFAPASFLGKKSATLVISSNDPKKATLLVKLSGQAIPKNTIEGIWDIRGKMTIKVSIDGEGSQTQRTAFTDEFTFYDDGYFEMIDMDGIWSQNGTNFIVTLDPESVSDYFAYYLEDEIGSDVYIEGTQMTFTGKKQKNGTIKGTVKLYMDFYIDDYDMSGKITVSSSYTGNQISTLSMSSMKERKASLMQGYILNVIQQELDNIGRAYSRMP